MKLPVTQSLVVLAVAAALAACAGNAPVKSPEPVAVNASAPATAAASAPATGEAGKMPGYRRVVRNGEEYFCKREGVTGSRVASTEVCLTQAEMQTIRERSQDDLRDMQNPAYLEPSYGQPPY